MLTSNSELMYIYQLPHTERHKLCQILDMNNRWEELGGTHMKYDALTIHDLQKAVYRGKSPTEELLTLWGSQNHSVLELFVLLHRMKHFHAMSTIVAFIPPKYHKLIPDETNRMENLMRNVAIDEVNVAPLRYVNVDPVNFVRPVYLPQIQGFNPNIRGSIPVNPIRAPAVRPQIVVASEEDNEKIPAAYVNQFPPKARSPILDGTMASAMSLESGSIPNIPYEELQRSTNNWDATYILGRGGFGTVFKGIWKCTKVAIKRIESKADDPESHAEQMKQSITELTCLNAYRHDNILPLYGYSIRGPQPCLVYQFMSGGSLEYRLHTRDASKIPDWASRLNIAIGTARGLQYLHTIGDKPLIHGDIKSANILLDPNNTPRIGDFGLARAGPDQKYTHLTVDRIQGTRPYLPDEFLRAKKFSTKVDTYSFGVLLFELGTGIPAYTSKLDVKYLKEHIVGYEGDPNELKDPRIPADCTNANVFRRMIEIGKVCVSKRPKDRPEMVQVLISLEKVT